MTNTLRKLDAFYYICLRVYTYEPIKVYRYRQQRVLHTVDGVLIVINFDDVVVERKGFSFETATWVMF